MQVSSNLPKLDLVECLPPWWARTGHQQTIWGHILPSPSLSSAGEKLEIELPDGDRLVTYFREGKSDIVVSLYHGLSGDMDGNYMHRTALLCESLGITWVRVNHRGAGEGHGLAKNPYHSGRGADISAVLKTLRQKFPGKKQIAIGFSMSGNILLYLLSGLGGDEFPDGAITVNAAINLERASSQLSQGWNRIYDLNFVQSLRASIKEKQQIGLAPKDIHIPPLASVWDIDELYTARVCGYRDRLDYYARCSAKNHLEQIKVPTYVMTSEDDPFIAIQDYREAKWSSNVNLHIEKHGGHLGYISREVTPLGTKRWLDHYLFQAIQSLRNFIV